MRDWHVLQNIGCNGHQALSSFKARFLGPNFKLIFSCVKYTMLSILEAMKTFLAYFDGLFNIIYISFNDFTLTIV